MKAGPPRLAVSLVSSSVSSPGVSSQAAPGHSTSTSGRSIPKKSRMGREAMSLGADHPCRCLVQRFSQEVWHCVKCRVE